LPYGYRYFLFCTPEYLLWSLALLEAKKKDDPNYTIDYLDYTMGGNAAWRKRVAKGELAKGAGGAALRHRPRLGRRGEDLKLNRKGNIAGGNPKKMNKRKDNDSSFADEAKSHQWYDFREWSNWVQVLAMILTLYVVIGTSAKLISGRKNRVE
jgi:hypothetical protein